MHADSIFYEIELVEKLETSSRTSHRETPRCMWKSLMKNTENFDGSREKMI
jgi:hypothetical protein